MKDPKTGIPPKRWQMVLLAWLGPVLPGAIAIALLMISIEPTAVALPTIAPEMIVKAQNPPQFACVSESLFEQAVTHSVRGEKTKFRAMFNDGSCLAIPEDEGLRFKILAVHRSIVEFTNIANKQASNGLWADSSSFSPAQ